MFDNINCKILGLITSIVLQCCCCYLYEPTLPSKKHGDQLIVVEDM